MWKRKFCTSLVSNGYYNPNPNSLVGFGLGMVVAASSGIFAMFTIFATKDDLNNSTDTLRREMQSNTQLILERMENMILKSKR